MEEQHLLWVKFGYFSSNKGVTAEIGQIW